MKEKLKAAIVDDDWTFVELLKNKVDKMAYKYNYDFDVIGYKDLKEFDKCANIFDLLFIDIEFSDQNCFKWLHKWQNVGKVDNVIFVSAHDEYVFQSFANRPIAFVRKVHLDEDLERALTLFEKQRRIILPLQISVPEGRKVHLFEINELLYLQGCGHYIEFHLKDEAIRVLRGKMNDMEKILRIYGFVRIHVRYLINIRYITSVNNNQMMLKNGQKFQISRKYNMLIFDQLKIFLTRDDN